MIILKTESEIARMRKAGQIVAQVLKTLAQAIEPNKTSPIALNFLAERLVLEAGGFPAFKGYKGYPASLCVAVNEQIVHAIPTPYPLKEGDIVGLDIGVFYEGFCADGALTVGVGPISEEAQRLLKVTEEALYKGIEAARPGNRIGDISYAIQRHTQKHGYSVAKGLAGHGVGRTVHEEPSVPNEGKPGKGPLLRVGMTLAIEPMICMGKPETSVLPDGWTVVTTDGSLAAHFEHTVAITPKGAEILTLE